MDKMTRLSAEERDNLVAYLDGELDEQQAQQIERKLGVSQVARHDVELLARSWDLLDLLPRPKVGDEFTRRTVSIAKQAEIPSSGWPLWRSRLRRAGLIGLWSIALGSAAVLGYRGTHDWIPNDADLLLRELPVIEDLDMYTEVRDIEFLRELRRQGLFVTDQPGPGRAEPNEADASNVPPPPRAPGRP